MGNEPYLNVFAKTRFGWLEIFSYVYRKYTNNHLYRFPARSVCLLEDIVPSFVFPFSFYRVRSKSIDSQVVALRSFQSIHCSPQRPRYILTTTHHLKRTRSLSKNTRVIVTIIRYRTSFWRRRNRKSNTPHGRLRCTGGIPKTNHIRNCFRIDGF